MTALHGLVEAVVAALLVTFVARSFFGPGPAQRDAVTATMWLAAALLLLLAVLVAPGPALPRELLAGGAVIAAAEAGWWLRSSRDDGRGDGGQETGGPPLDWDEFDRARRGWDRPKTLA